MPTAYLVASEIEISNSQNWNDLMPLFERYEVMAGMIDFQEVYSLSRLFFHNEEYIPTDIQKTLDDGSKFYQFDSQFIEKAASLGFEEQCNLSAIWLNDKFWKGMNPNGMDLAGFLMELTVLSKIAIKENKNLYIIEEKR